MKTPFALLVLALLLAGCSPPTDRPAEERDPTEVTGFVYTADEDGNSLTMVDLATGQARQVPLGISPHNVQITEDGALVLLVGPRVADAAANHVHGSGDGLLVVLDAVSLEEVRAPIPVGDHPAHVVADGRGRFAYVTDSGPNTVMVVDLQAGQVVGEIATCAYPHGLRMSPDGAELYVACVEANEVAVIDVAAGEEAARVEVGRAPVQVGFIPAGTRVYVSLRDENAVGVIDTRSREVLSRIPVGRGPIQLFATPDGRYIYVANEGTEEDPDHTVSVIAVASGEVVATVTTGAGAHGVVISDDGALAVISNLFAGTVSVIDVASQTVVAEFPVGDGPAGVTYRPAGGR
jgi:YVTN family beta-propeller protein